MTAKLLLLVLFTLAVVIALARRGVFTRGRAGQGEHWPVFPKKLLSSVEQTLYQRLIRAFPEHVVLSQVALSQLVGVKKGPHFRAVWNRYNRLVADFVICSRDFSVVAVLELDDRSHDNPARQDADRRKAAICEAAGIPLHRLNVNPLPNEIELRGLLNPSAAIPALTGDSVINLRDRNRSGMGPGR
jgi:hypothetical protein